MPQADTDTDTKTRYTPPTDLTPLPMLIFTLLPIHSTPIQSNRIASVYVEKIAALLGDRLRLGAGVKRVSVKVRKKEERKEGRQEKEGKVESGKKSWQAGGRHLRFVCVCVCVYQ